MTPPTHPYSMKIERLVVDKLGLKLYDKVAAVVAELVANAYDADAENVTVRLPLGKRLATKKPNGEFEQKGYVIEVVDDGHGMTPEEANAFYLKVGKDRRADPKQGNKSRIKKRPVTGRKGIGKLAPFGVCETIQVRSAGGTKTAKGYKVSHFELDYKKIVSNPDEEYYPAALSDNDHWDARPGTKITLKNFLNREVPDKDTFHNQLCYRFGLQLPDWKITVQDNKEPPEAPFVVGQHNVPIMEGTKISVDNRPVKLEDGTELKVTGWVAMAKQSYKNNEFAGVRIYVRGKIAAVTRDFGLPAGFTGEYVARSYLVGELQADWLDDSEDLIQTHRQDILWSSDIGQSFSKWGQTLLKEVAKQGREPRRLSITAQFFQKSGLATKVKARFEDPELQTAALQIGDKIGGFASEEELDDDDYVSALTELILTVAPHKMLIDAFQRIQELGKSGKVDMTELVKIFKTTQIAQLASYGQIVQEKIKAIDILETSIRDNSTTEADLQKILEDAPWLIDPRWNLLTANQTLETFRSAFENWFKQKYGTEITTTTQIANPTKRPDFIFIHRDNALNIVEIKPPNHVFNDADWERLNNYNDAIELFLSTHQGFKADFPRYQIWLICKEIRLGSTVRKAMDHLCSKNILRVSNWEDLIRDTKQYHSHFLAARRP